jgi:hypothetical protein
MIPDNVINMIVMYFFHRVDAGDSKEEAMTKALTEGLKFVCECGEPLNLGVIHHKNAPCSVQK